MSTKEKRIITGRKKEKEKKRGGGGGEDERKRKVKSGNESFCFESLDQKKGTKSKMIMCMILFTWCCALEGSIHATEISPTAISSGRVQTTERGRERARGLLERESLDGERRIKQSGEVKK